jgi:CheY-like chemotaxis protein
MSLDSEPGRGSTFRVTVPLGFHWDGARPAPSRLAGTRTLVVDDNAAAREAVRSLLVARGVRTETVADGAAALERLRRAAEAGEAFDVVVVDAAMPRMDGFELAARMSLVDALRSTGILLLTTGRPLDAGTARQLGVGAWISKPVMAAELEHAFVELLERPRRPAAGASPSPAPAAPLRPIPRRSSAASRRSRAALSATAASSA